LRPWDERVLAVEAVAPAVERADEAVVACPATCDDSDAAVTARVLEGAHAHVVGAQHDHRLIEDLVLGVIAGIRALLEPARHLPRARPQQLGFELIEIRVEVALLGDPVRHLDRERHGQRRALPTRDRHEPHTNRSLQSAECSTYSSSAPASRAYT